jgi:hypothetical protein
LLLCSLNLGHALMLHLQAATAVWPWQQRITASGLSCVKGLPTPHHPHKV